MKIKFSAPKVNEGHAEFEKEKYSIDVIRPSTGIDGNMAESLVVMRRYHSDHCHLKKPFSERVLSLCESRMAFAKSHLKILNFLKQMSSLIKITSKSFSCEAPVK